MRYPVSFEQGAARECVRLGRGGCHEGRSSHGRKDFTMTHHYWDLLIKDFRCPGLKVELVRDNPLGIDTS